MYRLDRFTAHTLKWQVSRPPRSPPPLVVPLKTCRFNILEQILLYIELVHSRYYIKVHLLMSTFFFLIYSVTNMSLGDVESIISGNQSSVTHCELSLNKFNFYLKYSTDSLYIGFHFQSLTILS